MQISIRTQLDYEVCEPTSFFFNVAVADTEHQHIVHESLSSQPALALGMVDDVSGNRFAAVSVSPGAFSLRYEAAVAMLPYIPPTAPHTATPFVSLPADVLTYMRPSRYCESDLLNAFAGRTFMGIESGFDRTTAICEWVHSEIDYVAGSTGPTTTAVEVFTQRAGVCRDFAHLGITLCRSSGIPARYVSGYAVGLKPPDFHGFFEAYLDGHWYLFDATEMARPDQLVRIGTGRDAADVAFASYIGNAILTDKEVTVTVDESPESHPEAVSTA
jgi:transglutaminase-like putative cysteine protease